MASAKHIRPCLKKHGRYSSKTTSGNTSQKEVIEDVVLQDALLRMKRLSTNDNHASDSKNTKHEIYTKDIVEHCNPLPSSSHYQTKESAIEIYIPQTTAATIDHNLDVKYTCITPEEFQQQSLNGMSSSEEEEEEEVFGDEDIVYYDSSIMAPQETTQVKELDSFPFEDASIDSDEEENGTILDLFVEKPSDAYYEEQALPETTEKRAFSILWKAISNWITPEACEAALLFSSEENNSNITELLQVDTSDIGSSRCGGLMSMIKLHLSRAFLEIKLVDDTTQQLLVERRLAVLFMRFDFTLPMVKLDSAMWQALTVLFVDIVLPSTTESENEINIIPTSALAVGLSIEEYRYLTRSLFVVYKSDEQQNDH